MRIVDLRRAAALTVASVLWAAGCSDGTGPGNPAELEFVAVPLSLSRADVLAPAVAVAVRDSRGNTVEWTGEITLTLEGGIAGGALEGTTRRTALGGIAVFDDLRISSAGSDYRLVARAGSLTEAATEPFDVHAVFKAASVTTGRQHTCALTADGTAYCWGGNAAGQLGTGDTEDRSVPTRVQTQVRFSSIDAFWGHTCAVSQGGDVYCWGANGVGEVGDGTTVSRTTPTLVGLPGPALSVAAGYGMSCAVLADRRAHCWGWNGWGALGIGEADGAHPSPAQVNGDHEWVKIDAGYRHTCGLTTAGDAYCWGDNRYGATGVGVFEGSTWTPTEVRGGHHFADLETGGGVCSGKTCGVTTDGRTLCWGRHYQSFGGGILRYSPEPKPITWDAAVVEVTVGTSMVCGFTAGRRVHCLGTPTAFTPPDPNLSVATLAQGRGHACFITTDGDTFCWGTNENGELGSGIGSAGWFERRGVWAPPGG
jgi:alpha-tubulin suppressor-like RCC1 family protein